MKKLYFFILLTLICLSVYSQKYTTDSIYYTTDETNIDNFQDIYIRNFTFVNPTVNSLAMSLRIFEPTTKNITTDNQKINGKVKKITEYVKYSKDKDKRVKAYTIYNEKTLKTLSNESGYINVHYVYDLKNRISNQVRIVNNDTISIHIFKYNDRDQLTEFKTIQQKNESLYKVEYDERNRPITVKNENPKATQYEIYYDNNIVRTKEIYGENITEKEYVYSENNNLIKEIFSNYIVFYSYNPNNQLIKKVTFIDKKLNNIQLFDYNEKGNLIRHSFQFAIDKANGTKAEDISEYKYDEWNNIIYKMTSGTISANTVEYFYEIEYF